jgi:hypothetical protein
MDIDGWWDREKNAASPGTCGMSHDADWRRHPAAMIGLRDEREKEGDWQLASVSRGGRANRSYSDGDVRKGRHSPYFPHISPAFSANYSLAFDEVVSRREASHFSGISRGSLRILLDTRISYFEMDWRSRRIPRKIRGIGLELSATSP